MAFLTIFIIGIFMMQTARAETVTGTNYTITQPTGTFGINAFAFSSGTFAMTNATENTGNYAQALSSKPDNATSQSDVSIILTLEENVSATTDADWTVANLFTYRTIFNDSITPSYSDCLYNNTAFDDATDNITVSAGLISVNLSNCISANDTVEMRFVYNVTVTAMVTPTVVIYYTSSTHDDGIALPITYTDTTASYTVGYDFDFTMRCPNYASLSAYDVNLTVVWTPPDNSVIANDSLVNIYLYNSTSGLYVNQTITWASNIGSYAFTNFVSNLTQIQFNSTWNLGYDIDKYDGYDSDSRKLRKQYQYWNTTTTNPQTLYLNVSWYDNDADNIIDKIDTFATTTSAGTYNRYYAERYNTFYHRLSCWILGGETESVEVVYWKDPAEWEDTHFPVFNITLIYGVGIAICIGAVAVGIFYFLKD